MDNQNYGEVLITDRAALPRITALAELKRQLEASVNLQMKDMTPGEEFSFSVKHPGAHFVIGDFEIKCLNPQKYGLE